MTPEEARAEQARLMVEANELTEYLLKRLERYKPSSGRLKRTTIDSRVVAVACARVAGTYISMIHDPDVRKHYTDHFTVLFGKIIESHAPLTIPPGATKQ